MLRLVIFLFPILACMIDQGILFIAGYRLTDAGAPPSSIVARLGLRALAYALVSLGMTRIITPKRSPWLIVTAASILLSISLIASHVYDVHFYFLWCTMSGAAVALYSTSFQVFMKRLEGGAKSGVIHSTALYTAAWSFGAGIGPYFFGRFSDNTAYLINACSALFIILCAIFINHCYPERPAIDTTTNTETAPASIPVDSAGCRRPNLVLMGWISGAFISCVLSIVLAIGPTFIYGLNYGKFHAGAIIATVFGAQALGGFLLIVSKDWMYRIKPLVVLACFGITAFTLFAVCGNIVYLYLAAICLGINSAGAYFLFVYHSLVHPTHSSKYVAFNETIVGVMTIVAIFISGGLSQFLNIRSVFVAGAGLTVLMLATQLLFMRFKPLKD